MRIVFMGTPDFAVPSLEGLISAGHEVCGVFSQPDKPVGGTRTSFSLHRSSPAPQLMGSRSTSLPSFGMAQH